jgi:hypothetical protein
MKRPSPSMSVALLALFVALGGSAVAASGLITGRQIKDGTVRRADLAKSAVDSTKVANGSLSSNDFDAATRSTINQAGTQVLEAFRAAGPTGVEPSAQKVVATLSDIPPGAYAIFAKTILSGTSTNGILNQGNSIGGKCTLDVEGDADNGQTLIGTPGANAPSDVNMQITHTYSSPGTAKVTCGVTGATWAAANTSIIALRVSAPQRQSVEGR